MKFSLSLSGKASTILSVLGILVSFFSLLLSIREIAYPEEASVIERIQFRFGFITLLLGNIAVRSIKDKTLRNLVSTVYLIYSLAVMIMMAVVLFT